MRKIRTVRQSRMVESLPLLLTISSYDIAFIALALIGAVMLLATGVPWWRSLSTATQGQLLLTVFALLTGIATGALAYLVSVNLPPS